MGLDLDGCVDCLLGEGCRTALHVGNAVPGAVLVSVGGGTGFNVLLGALGSVVIWPHVISSRESYNRELLVFGASYFAFRYAQLSLASSLAIAGVLAFAHHVAFGTFSSRYTGFHLFRPRLGADDMLLNSGGSYRCSLPQWKPYDRNPDVRP